MARRENFRRASQEGRGPKQRGSSLVDLPGSPGLHHLRVRQPAVASRSRAVRLSVGIVLIGTSSVIVMVVVMVPVMVVMMMVPVVMMVMMVPVVMMVMMVPVVVMVMMIVLR
jgi:hypothetical protein